MPKTKYTPTTRPKQSRVRQQISKSVKSSGWFGRKSRVSGQTQLARVAPHEDDTSHKKLTRAVSWAKSHKGTLTVAHTEYEGPSLVEALEEITTSYIKRAMQADIERAKKKERIGRTVASMSPVMTDIQKAELSGEKKGEARKSIETTKKRGLKLIAKNTRKRGDRSLSETKDWMDKAVKRPGRCTPMPNPDCPPGSPQYELGLRFKKAARKKERHGGTGWQGEV